MAREFAKAFYRSKEWQNARDCVLKRDAYLCVKCGRPAEEVHHKIHLTPDNIFDARIALDQDNLISLCKDCHFVMHREDKIKGLRNRKNKEACEVGYCFNEEGFLVKRDAPR